MRISTLVDSNILIDVLGPVDLPHRGWSLAAVKRSLAEGVIVITPVTWAELAFGPTTEASLTAALSWLAPHRENLPFAAAFPAGRAHRLYRERGGQRERTLPDFLIGAHALVAGHRLLTRDPVRYRTYFPDLEIICPETHP